MEQLIASYDRSRTNCPIVSNLYKDRLIVLVEYIVRRDRIKSERYAHGHVCVKRSREWSSHSYEAPLRLAAVYGMLERDKGLYARARTLSCHPSAAAARDHHCQSPRGCSLSWWTLPRFILRLFAPLVASIGRTLAILDARISRNCVHATALIHPLCEFRSAFIKPLVRYGLIRLRYVSIAIFLKCIFSKEFQWQLIFLFLSLSFISWDI